MGIIGSKEELMESLGLAPTTTPAPAPPAPGAPAPTAPPAPPETIEQEVVFVESEIKIVQDFPKDTTPAKLMATRRLGAAASRSLADGDSVPMSVTAKYKVK